MTIYNPMEQKINRLAVNGCSYIKLYAQGNGHVELAQQLGLDTAIDLASNGSCNDRIIRSTLQDSFCTTIPTLYIIGITFLTRYELPIGRDSDKWLSFTTSGETYGDQRLIDQHISDNELKTYSKLYAKFTTLGLPDIAENLIYQLIAMADSLQSRQHKVVIFNTAEQTVDYFLQRNSFDILKTRPEIIDGLKWKSNQWQFEQGARPSAKDQHLPLEVRHVDLGEHKWLNEFLTAHVNQCKLLS